MSVGNRKYLLNQQTLIEQVLESVLCHGRELGKRKGEGNGIIQEKSLGADI